MSGPIPFTPKHPQPFTLEEAMQLEVETLTTEINRLTNSIQHLSRTQDELTSYLRSEEGRSDPDTTEVEQAVEENEEVIASQSERISLITIALRNKLGGETRLEHYGFKMDEVFAKYGKGGGPNGVSVGAGLGGVENGATAIAPGRMAVSSTVGPPTNLTNDEEGGLHL
ncbi:hypothetical protein IAR55_003345 [Kwoniella newhampshirensis]|uniref:Uncharacterized protein n=1 Tax=Kwoniella newhampshirensis TaxID=1651941 RepID=A0AAW0YQN4_9TREE